jgi:NDP-sugar pyrophosphorylase family protein
MKAFCILAAGKGVRINKISSLHKCLLSINNLAVISHIINKAPEDSEIIIAIGHQKEIVKEYCLAAHPDKKLKFVEVDNYDGPGSGPGYSLSKCREHLQKPFYLVCSDCIVTESLPGLDKNWIGTFPITDPENWSTAQVDQFGKVKAFKNKSKQGYNQAWIGIAGIKDYEVFWNEMKSGEDKEFEMVSAFYRPEAYPEILSIPFTWHDTGTPENYKESKNKLGHQRSLGMAKEIDEVTYKVGNRCVKVFGNSKVAQDRIKRTESLAGLIPNMVFKGNHVYAYEWVDGKTLYEENSLESFTGFLKWCDRKLWKPVEVDFRNFCWSFYKDKTYSRLKSYFSKKGTKDTSAIINGIKCEPIEEYLQKIDWHWLAEGIPVRFHGDLQPENVIVDNEKYWLIDWRDSFDGLTICGDLYYDLAKLNGGLGMSYHAIKSDKFWVEKNDGEIKYHFEITKELEYMKYCFENWVLEKGYDLRKVRVLTALVYLNMSPLHTKPFDELLFNHAKKMLALTL